MDKHNLGRYFGRRRMQDLGDQSGRCGAQQVIAEAAVPFPGGHWAAAAALFGAALFMVFSSEQREIC